MNMFMRNAVIFGGMVAIIVIACVFPLANAGGQHPPLRFKKYPIGETFSFSGEILADQSAINYSYLPDGNFIHIKLKAKNANVAPRTVSCPLTPAHAANLETMSKANLQVTGKIDHHTPEGIVLAKRSCAVSNTDAF